MTEKQPKILSETSPSKRPIRVLWANVYCLLDTSSGASIMAREMLRQLHGHGYQVEILGALNFDSPVGITRIEKHWKRIQSASEQAVLVDDPPLSHRLLKTANTRRQKMTAQEESTWMGLYQRTLDTFQPDVVFYYGGQPLDWLIASEARTREIAVAAFVVNGNYAGTRWCRDVDLLLTDSEATASLYRQRTGRDVTAVGAFIDPAPVVAQQHTRKHVLLVNPSQEKGALIAIKLALMLEKRRPDIVFEVVESRGDWPRLVNAVTEQLGSPRSELSNVVVTPHNADMRPVYSRARVLLALSLWWESFGRVAAEAVMNGIPVFLTERGGIPEAAGAGGIAVSLPSACFEAPYHQVPTDAALMKLATQVERLFDDETLYQHQVDKANSASEVHDRLHNTRRLMEALNQTIGQKHALRPAPAVSHSLPGVKSVLVHSFIGGPHSMGRVGEQLLRHLINANYDVSLLPFQNEKQRDSWPEEYHSRVMEKNAQIRQQQQIQFCSVHEARQKRQADYLSPWFFHDVDGLTPTAVADINSNDWVYVTSHLLRDIFINHGVTVPVHVMHLGYDADFYKLHERNISKTFNFLCIAENTPRKNLSMLVHAFQVAFDKNAAVKLVIKTGLRNVSELEKMTAESPSIVIHSKPIAKETSLVDLYKDAHCFVLPTRFEGFGLPVLEAMATGLPVITTDYGGQLDFCSRHNSYLITVKRMIEADLTCFPHMRGWWAEPDFDHLVSLLRLVYEQPSGALETGKRAYQSVRHKWTWQQRMSECFPKS